MNTSSVVNLHRFLMICILCFLAGCAADPVSLKLENSLPPDKLSYYSDSFDKFRDDLWDKSAVLYKDSQLENFQLADMIYRDGKLIITTQKDCFSKASLSSRFTLKGDFDIQLDCRFNLLRGVYPMDQVMFFGVFDKSSGEIGDMHLVLIGVSQNYARSRIRVYSKVKNINSGGGIFRSEEIQGFSGSLRMARIGQNVTTYYRQSMAPWKKLSSYPLSTGNLNVGFALQNFTAKIHYLDSALPVTAEFIEFKINAAQGIVEEDI